MHIVDLHEIKDVPMETTIVVAKRLILSGHRNNRRSFRKEVAKWLMKQKTTAA